MVGFSPNVALKRMSRERTNERTVCGEAWPNDFACYTWIIQFLFLFYILFCAHSLETVDERIFHFCSAARDDAIIQLDEISSFLSSFDLRDRIFKKTTKHLFIFFFRLWGVNNSNCFVWTFELFILCYPHRTATIFLTLINNSSSFVKHVSEWFFAPWERNLSWPRFFFLSCYCAAGETGDANDRLDPQSVRRHSTIFLCWLKTFSISTPVKSWLWWIWVGVGKTGPKSNSYEDFYSIAVKCKKNLFFFIRKLCFKLMGKMISFKMLLWRKYFWIPVLLIVMEVISILFFI